MIIRVLLYVLLGLAIVVLNLWYVTRVRKAFFTRGAPDTIAPFQLIGKDDPEGKSGAAMARLLHARLSSIQREVESARDALRASLRIDPTQAVVPVVGAGAGRSNVHEIERRLTLRLYDPPNIAMKVYGVELGGLLAWAHETLSADRYLRIVVQYGAQEARVGGALGDDPAQSIWLRTKADDEDIISKIGYSLWQREMAKDVPEVAALDPLEFGELIHFLVRFAELSRQHAIVERDAKRWEELLPAVLEFAQRVPGWDDLQQVAGLVALRAGRLEDAARSFEAARALVTRSLQRVEEELAAAAEGPATQPLRAAKADLEAQLKALDGALEMIGGLDAAAGGGGGGPRTALTASPGDLAEPILALLDARGLKPARPVRVAVFGGVPPAALRKGLKHRVVGPRAQAAGDRGLSEYTGQLSHTILALAGTADVEFLYAPLPAQAFEAAGSHVEDALQLLLAEGPDILVVGLGITPDLQRRLAPVLESAAAANVVAILSAGNEGDQPIPFTGLPLAQQMLIVSAADHRGGRLAFSQQGPESVWVPGDQVPTVRPAGDEAMRWTGTGPASAVAAGVVAQLLGTQPSVRAEDLVRRLRETAAVPAGNAKGVPLLQVQKAAKALAKGG